MNTARKKPKSEDWLGMRGVLSGDSTRVELEIIETIERDGHISTRQNPHIRKEHVQKINALLQEFHYDWRIADEHGKLDDLGEDLSIFHIHHQRMSTTI